VGRWRLAQWAAVAALGSGCLLGSRLGPVVVRHAPAGPLRLLIGAYLFGTVTIMGFVLQGFGVGIPSQLLSSLPYVVTVLALVVISGNRTLMRANTPACLGQAFVPDR